MSRRVRRRECGRYDLGSAETQNVGHVTRHRGDFPTEQAALKVLYLVATRSRPNRHDLSGRVQGWKGILNTLYVHYGDRIDAVQS